LVVRIEKHVGRSDRRREKAHRRRSVVNIIHYIGREDF
jgi:hypothetical protein